MISAILLYLKRMFCSHRLRPENEDTRVTRCIKCGAAHVWSYSFSPDAGWYRSWLDDDDDGDNWRRRGPKKPDPTPSAPGEDFRRFMEKVNQPVPQRPKAKA